MRIIAGNSNLPLSKSVAEYLGENLTNASITRFADDEVYVEIKENIRGEDVFVMESLSYPSLIMDMHVKIENQGQELLSQQN